MIDSLRDQLLNLGFKAPEPERKPAARPGQGPGPGPGPGGQGKGGPRTAEGRGRQAPRGPGKDGGQRPRVDATPGKGAGRGDGGSPARRKAASEMDLGKAWALRAQHDKQERLDAERLKQEQARLRREAKLKLEALLQDKALNDAGAEIARHFEYGGKIKRIYVTPLQLKALNTGELGVLQLNGRYLLVDATVLAEAEAVYAPAVALKVDPGAAVQDDPYADPSYQVPDDLVW